MRYLPGDKLISVNTDFRYQTYVVLSREGDKITVERTHRTGKKSTLVTTQQYLRAIYRDSLYTLVKEDGSVYSNKVQEVTLAEIEKEIAIHNIIKYTVLFIFLAIIIYIITK